MTTPILIVIDGASALSTPVRAACDHPVANVAAPRTSSPRARLARPFHGSAAVELLKDKKVPVP